MSVRSTILAAAALVAGIAAPAFAQSPEFIEVSYGDLNLTSDAGRQVLDSRIAGAAEQLCGQARSIELTWNAAVQTCRSETIAQTRPQRDAALRYGTVEIAQAAPAVRVSRAAN